MHGIWVQLARSQNAGRIQVNPGQAKRACNREGALIWFILCPATNIRPLRRIGISNSGQSRRERFALSSNAK
jgi:hypothetical protein